MQNSNTIYLAESGASCCNSFPQWNGQAGTVVPMTSSTETHLISADSKTVVAPGLGASPKFRALIAERLWEVCAKEGWDNNCTGAILVGQGAERLAQELNMMGPVAEVVSQVPAASAEVDNWVVLPLEAETTDEWPEDWSVDRPLTSDPRIVPDAATAPADAGPAA